MISDVEYDMHYDMGYDLSRDRNGDINCDMGYDCGKIHSFIVAPPGTGKSTLIRRLVEELSRPVFGFLTKKEADEWDEDLGNPIYIYPAGQPQHRSEENRVGYCKDRRPVVYAQAFDRFAPKLWEPVVAGIVILMDEIGFMESASEAFCKGIFHLLDGDIPVIAAVKDKDTTFLNIIRSHPKAKLFYLTTENREETFLAVLEEVRKHLPTDSRKP